MTETTRSSSNEDDSKSNSTAKEVEVIKSVKSWIDLDEESDSDTGFRLTELQDLLTTSEGSKLDLRKGIRLPGGFEQAFPIWDAIIKAAAAFLKKEVVYSEDVIVSANDVIFADAFSMKKQKREEAIASMLANEKNYYAAYRSINSIFKFFTCPIDVGRNNYRPTQGESWIFDKLVYDYHRSQCTELIFQELKIGSRSSDHRQVIQHKISSLLHRSASTAIPSQIVSALDALIFEFIKKIYRSSAKSKYFSQLIEFCKTTGDLTAERLARTVRRKKVTWEFNPKTRKKERREENIPARLKPWVAKHDDFWLPEEKVLNVQINSTFGEKMGETLEDSVTQSASLSRMGRQYIAASDAAWRISDAMNRVVKKRRREVRNLAYSKREGQRSERLTPTEWQGAVKELMTDKPTRFGEYTDALIEVGLIVNSTDLKNQENKNSFLTDSVKKVMEDAADYCIDEVDDEIPDLEEGAFKNNPNYLIELEEDKISDAQDSVSDDESSSQN